MAEGLTGELRLRVALRGGRSVAAGQFHQGALRVLRPHYLDGSGQVAYTVVNPGGAYFGADRYGMDLDVEEDASLLLTTQSATKVYRTPQGPAEQEMRIRLAAGASLEYVPDQLIVYRGGSYRQRTRVEMAPSASLLLSEVVTPGWSPSAEPFRYDRLDMRTEVVVLADPDARRLVVDQLRLHPGEGRGVSGVGMLEGHSHTGQLLVADRRLDEALYDELTGLVDASDTTSGITWAGSGRTHGVRCVCVRSLAHSTGRIVALHHAVAGLLRARWRRQPALHLRKY